jgi:hypothetical protein
MVPRFSIPLHHQVRFIAAEWAHYTANSPAARHRQAMAMRTRRAIEAPRSDLRAENLKVLARNPEKWHTVYDMVGPLSELGHDVRPSGIGHSLARMARSGQIEHRSFGHQDNRYRIGVGK